MDLKRFFQDCAGLQEWLNREGYDESLPVIMKIITAILAGEKQPEQIMGRALAPGPLTAMLKTRGDEADGGPLPDRIFNILGHWLYQLPDAVDILGQTYERLVSGRRKNGIYYTPENVVEFILKQTIAEFDLLTNPRRKILDPACGSGIFLLKAYDWLFKKYRQNEPVLRQAYPGEDWSAAGIHRHIINYNLWGADIDETAAAVTAVSLLLKLPAASTGLIPNILTYDSLKRPQAEMPGKVRKFWAAHYDCVIGNPPYLSFGLRNTGTLPAAYREYLKHSYGETAEYKLSYYALFLQRGLEMLVNGGRLGYILPDSFLLGRYYSKIRRYILQQAAIEAIVQIIAPVFKGASTGYSTICILRKEADPQLRDQQLVRLYRLKKAACLNRPPVSYQYSQNYFKGLPHFRFRLLFDAVSKNLIDRIDNQSIRLGEFATGHTGVRSKTRQADIIATSPAAGDTTWRRGLISGAQVIRYNLKYDGHWLNIKPDALYKGGWQTDIVSQRKIMLRQTGDSIIACIDNDGYYHLNNIHSLILKKPTITLDYLLLLLNSRLMAFYYHAVTGEHGRSMAQIDIETLELLPIIVQESINRQAPELVKIASELVRKKSRGIAGAAAKLVSFREYLNQLVYHIYNLSDEEVSYIEKAEAGNY